MANSKDGQPGPGTYHEINEAGMKAQLHEETFATPGVGARILQKRNIPQPGNDEYYDTPPPEGKGR